MNLRLELRDLHKSYGTCVANQGLNLKVKRGSIHALVGENGAGKSTAMKILFGLESRDSGEILIDGSAAPIHSPADAVRFGIGMVHQHFMFSERDTALENLCLLEELISPYVLVSRDKVKEKYSSLAARYGIDLGSRASLRSYPVGIQQRFEILKLLIQNSDILIFDEPTAVLSPQEKDRFFEDLRELKKSGKTIIIITHKLKEIKFISDQLTVIRAGQTVESADTEQVTEQWIADRMVGRAVSLSGLERQNYVGDIQSLSTSVFGTEVELRTGEILGVAGVEGNGQHELIEAFKAFARSQKLKVGIIPQDRHHEGLLMHMSAWENIMLGDSSQSWFNPKREIALAARKMSSTDVVPANPELDAGAFSGGNQQKLIFSREFGKNPDLWLIEQPTRGVDVGAIELIHEKLLELRKQGVPILLISSELDELTALSDRLIVLSQKKVVASFERASFNESSIGLAMGGAAR